MLTAKSFAGLASVLFFFAILAKLHSSPPVRVYLQLIIALVCVISAATYFSAAQWTRAPLNRTLGLLQFGLISISVGVFAFGMHFYRLSLIESNFVDRYVFPASAASFLIACALFAANAAWTVIRLGRIQTNVKS